MPLIHGKAQLGERAIFSEHREDPILRRMGHGSGVMVSLRRGRWKFILNEEGSQLLPKPRVELYDLGKDPGEQNNVADVHPEVVQQLEREVETFRADHGQAASVEEPVDVDPEVLAQLRALGYVGDVDDAPDLWAAMKSGDPEEVRRSLKAGAHADQLEEVFGISPLAMAAMAGDVELAEVLLEGGAEVDVRSRDGSTPLSGAAFLGRVDVLVLLLDEGADPEAKNAASVTVLGATKVPWDATVYVADLFEIELDPKRARGRAPDVCRVAERSGVGLSPSQGVPSGSPGVKAVITKPTRSTVTFDVRPRSGALGRGLRCHSPSHGSPADRSRRGCPAAVLHALRGGPRLSIPGYGGLARTRLRGLASDRALREPRTGALRLLEDLSAVGGAQTFRRKLEHRSASLRLTHGFSLESPWSPRGDARRLAREGPCEVQPTLENER